MDTMYVEFDLDDHYVTIDGQPLIAIRDTITQKPLAFIGPTNSRFNIYKDRYAKEKIMYNESEYALKYIIKSTESIHLQILGLFGQFYKTILNFLSIKNCILVPGFEDSDFINYMLLCIDYVNKLVDEE